MIRERFQPEMSKDTLISIVDDDALARDGIRELVESLGYNAVTFMSAGNFLESGMMQRRRAWSPTCKCQD